MRGWFGRGAALACLFLAGGLIGALPLCQRAGAAAYPSYPAGGPLEVMRRPEGYRLMPGMAVLAAYQRPYAMNFEVWKPEGLPAGWYATFDGFPVAQVAENRWVYGQMGMDGALVPTDVLVGSVVPSEVPGLVRVAATWGARKYFDSPAFRKVLDHHCDRMAFLREPFVSTAIAWSTREPGVWVWLGSRWKRIVPEPGEYTWQALKRQRTWIIEELRRNNVWWFGGEADDLADLARQWGLLWGGSLALDSLNAYRADTGGNDASSEGGSVSHTSTPGSPSDDNNSRGDWDVGDD